eukprot:TRINITY_DN2502_c0_g1_i10.p2 TRINITY_DN2502_c0_g1~~TRINITY_DN2502_c0_g1_i10.p2  ORF type:complete len:115 (-),score=20.80 TRINITY_DN2502_c0_g1_i10:1168-1512(-)
MTAARSTPYYDMRVWDKQSYGSISFSHKDTEAPFLGHIMELGVIQGALVDRLKEFENVQLLCPEKILKIEFPPETHPGFSLFFTFFFTPFSLFPPFFHLIFPLFTFFSPFYHFM